ncbi:MAG TPA: beta-galactosidase GalB [bacterium]|nr:beta-galactosidase GalB [bacterium]HPR86818.1 beta-galactosidase GalB [bacterium]
MKIPRKMAISLSFALLAALAALASGCAGPAAPSRRIERFTKAWKFNLGDLPGAQEPGFADSGWRTLDLPHDWSIEGSFDQNNPATTGGGALPGGIGWYRKSFALASGDSGRSIFIDFDGVYRNAEVWINGHYLGKRPYGYSSFRYELTPWLRFGARANLVAVRVDNSQQPNSRWYSGSGIYRNVWLTVTGRIHVDHWGTWVSTPVVSAEKAEIRLQTRVCNATEQAQQVTVETDIVDPAGKRVATLRDEKNLQPGAAATVEQKTALPQPALWSVASPVLYRAVTRIRAQGGEEDRCETSFGIRSFVFDLEKGFSLNGVAMKLLGVCNHHDLGCLGAAVNERALERQLELLKAMGCNAIRTSHNPPAPELLDLCDRMGFLVMDEAFDMWKMEKNPFDYHLDWDEWHRRDLEDLILRDRNHPSVVLWSIGNEIPEQWDDSGTAMAQELAGIVRGLDPTRPITSACNDPSLQNRLIRSGALDIVGRNYHEKDLPNFPKQYPGLKLVASETNSAIATRGSYDMPSDSVRIWPIEWNKIGPMNPDLTCSAYDNCHVPWGSTHVDTWRIVRDSPFVSGIFIWTGFDYLGEPTPYPWPARSSYFGLIDLAGFPKDGYYFYQAEWTKAPMLHLFPHWNWKPGELIDVWAYTNQEEVELFLNGTSLGKKVKTAATFQLVWRVPWTAGTLKAVAYKGGVPVLEERVQTAGAAARIVLTADRARIKADGRDLSFVTIDIVDANGVLVPRADTLVKFSLQGPATIAGVDNGLQTSMESFKADQRKAFNGKCLCVVRANEQAGTIVLTARAEGLQEGVVEIRSE